jgi:osmoprotectant transport system ATP-binding protein
MSDADTAAVESSAHGDSAPTGPAAAGLELRNVQKRYPGQRDAAIPSLTLEVPAGEVCVLVGPSGSGKTTAMRLINRMIPLTGGDILIGGRSILDSSSAELRRQIGYVIQQVGLFPHQTVNENIATVPKLLGWRRQRIAARVHELLTLSRARPAHDRRRRRELAARRDGTGSQQPTRAADGGRGLITPPRLPMVALPIRMAT